MRALIVDDEPLARDGIRLLLAEHSDIELVGEAGNAAEALALVERTRPDLMLVDVQMPGMSGLELVAALPAGCAPTIVFVTAYEDYALKAFDVHALDYILKPIDDHRFGEAIRRARLQHELGGRLRTVELPSRLTIRDGETVTLLPTDDIDWVEAADYYVEIHAGERSYLLRETMQRLQAQLDDRFVRIHRSRLVNCDRVREIRYGSRGEMSLVTTTGAVLGVSRSCRPKIELLRRPR